VRRWLAAAAAVVVLAGLAPWPITVTGPFVVSPTAAAIVAPDSGVVFEVLVREGDRVAPGAPVALVRNLELERAEAAAARAVDSLGARETQARAAGRNGEAAQLIAERTAEATRLAGLAERVRALAIRSPGAAVVVSPRPDTLVGRSVWVGDTLLRLAGAEGLEARLALAGPGASLARPGQRARLIAHADPGRRLDASVTGVAEAASPDGTLESRVLLPAALGLLPGMTGEARVVLRDATVWGALWWAVRSRIRADILL
jgi:multidrug efflux pump subunit AcrA (membrane-fusion protein)